MDGPATSFTTTAPASEPAESDASTTATAPAPRAHAAQHPPAHLPADPQAFYRTAGPVDAISLAAQPESKHVLEQLGPPPFRKSSFPFVGFLASLYEHIAATVGKKP